MIEKILDSDGSYESKKRVSSPLNRDYINKGERFTFQGSLTKAQQLIDQDGREQDNVSLQPKENINLRSIVSEKFTTNSESYPILSEISKNKGMNSTEGLVKFTPAYLDGHSKNENKIPSVVS